MAKAKKIATYKDKYFTTIEYEYRGCTYEVSYPNDWKCLTSIAKGQHQDKQREIDEALDNPKPVTEAHPFDADEIYNLMGW